MQVPVKRNPLEQIESNKTQGRTKVKGANLVSGWRTLCGLVGLGLGLATPIRPAQETVRLVPRPFVTCWKDSTYRGRDIADNPYADTFFRGPGGPFSRYAGREAILTYERSGGAFRGRLVVRGLKPYFAYQMKLVGRPTREFGAAGDDETNERLGLTGRWWRKGPWEGNSSDWSYQNDHEKSDAIFVSYLLFGCFVTDRYGHATVDFAAATSAHAWWRTYPDPTSGSSSTPWRPEGRVTAYRVRARRSTGYGYDRDHPDRTVGLWTEIERFSEGTMVLPLGHYYCRFLLTEESFHQSGVGGYWQSALGADEIRFTIKEVDPPIITSPREGETVGPRVLLKGTSEPTEIIRIRDARTHTPLATARSGASGHWSVSVRLPAGDCCLEAVAHCGARQSEPSPAVAFRVEEVGPRNPEAQSRRMGGWE